MAFEQMQYNQNEINGVYDDLPDRRRQLITLISISPKEQIRRWKNENYETNKKYEENMIFETDRGELVRSKSELIIANILNQNKNLLYKYERPLELIINGRVHVFYPDSTILNINTGKITYWEHAGLMDDSVEFTGKMYAYTPNSNYSSIDWSYKIREDRSCHYKGVYTFNPTRQRKTDLFFVMQQAL